MYKFVLFVCFSIQLFGSTVLRIYTTDTFARGTGEKLKEEFEKKEKVTIQYITCQGAASAYIDILNEKKPSDGFIGLSHDIFSNSAVKNILFPHQIATENMLLPWKDSLLLPIFYNALSFVYNGKKENISASSFEDLLKLNKKIILIDPRTSHPGFGLLLWIKSIYGSQAASYWKSLKPKILTITKSWTEAYALFMQGESPIVLSYTTSPAFHRLKENNSNIRSLPFKEGHFLQVYVGGILKRTKNPALMQKFLEFALLPSLQKKIIYDDWSYPVKEIGEPFPEEFQPLKNFKIPFTPEEIERNKKEWITEWLNTMS